MTVWNLMLYRPWWNCKVRNFFQFSNEHKYLKTISFTHRTLPSTHPHLERRPFDETNSFARLHTTRHLCVTLENRKRASHTLRTPVSQCCYCPNFVLGACCVTTWYHDFHFLYSHMQANLVDNIGRSIYHINIYEFQKLYIERHTQFKKIQKRSQMRKYYVCVDA